MRSDLHAKVVDGRTNQSQQDNEHEPHNLVVVFRWLVYRAVNDHPDQVIAQSTPAPPKQRKDFFDGPLSSSQNAESHEREKYPEQNGQIDIHTAISVFSVPSDLNGVPARHQEIGLFQTRRNSHGSIVRACEADNAQGDTPHLIDHCAHLIACLQL